MTYDRLVYALLTFCAGVLALGTLACLARAVRGPSTADRLIAVNMTGTQVIIAVAVLTKILTERRAKK